MRRHAFANESVSVTITTPLACSSPSLANVKSKSCSFPASERSAGGAGGCGRARDRASGRSPAYQCQGVLVFGIMALVITIPSTSGRAPVW